MSVKDQMQALRYVASLIVQYHSYSLQYNWLISTWMGTTSEDRAYSLVWFILRPYQHDDDYRPIDGRSHIKVHTDERINYRTDWLVLLWHVDLG